MAPDQTAQGGEGRRLLRFVLRYRVAIALALACSFFSSAFVGTAVGLVPPLIQSLGEQANAMESAAAGEELAEAPPPAPRDPIEGFRGRIDGWRERILGPVERWLLEKGYVRIPLAIVFLYLLKGLFGFASVYGLRRVGIQAVADLRAEVYGKALAQSDAYYRNHSTGEMYSRILVDVGLLQNTLSNNVVVALQAVPLIVVLLIVSFVYAWQITLACLVVLPLFGYSAGRFGRRIKRSERKVQERSAELTKLIEETLLARRVVQAFGALAYEIERFRAALRRMLRQDLKVARTTAATSPVLELLGAVVGAAFLVFAGFLIASGRVQGHEVMGAIICLFVVFSNVRKLGQLNNALQLAFASAQRIFEVIDAPVAVTDAEGAVELAPFETEIRFEGTCFHYGRGPVLQGVDLTIRTGEVHALVGSSGAGKSTLAMMIPRFIDPTEGQVLIDGVSLSGVKLESLREQIALVTQETHLFDDTVFKNIAYGMESVDPEAVKRAARHANAAEFIESLPEGYETLLGDKGSQLSMGQRQRIAIARAFLKDARILVLDEATSALDTQSERLVQSALEALLEGRTALVIAHRLSTVTRADLIHVLDKGRIVESGKHDALLAQNGLYSRLHALQEQSTSQG